MKIRFVMDRGILGLYLRMTMICGNTTIDVGEGGCLRIKEAEETLTSLKNGVRLLEQNIDAMRDKSEEETARK